MVGHNQMSLSQRMADEQPALVDVQIASMQADLDEIKVTLAAIKETLVNTQGIVQKVAAEVMPTIDSLMKSPMLKMLLPKDKR